MQLETSMHEDFLLVRPAQARIDAAAAIQFKEAMRRALAETGDRRRVVLDMAPVTFLDSSGLGALVAVMKLCTPDRQLELAGLTQPVARVFRLTRMDRVFTVHEEVPASPATRMHQHGG